MLIYGKNVAREVLRKNKKISKIFLQKGFHDKEIISLIEKGNLKVEFKSNSEIDRLVDGVHQGIIISVPDYKHFSLEDILRDDASFIVLLDHLEDPHNLGAIIRTCEAASVDAIVMPQKRQVQVNATVMKTSVGTLEQVRIALVSNLVSTMKELKKRGFWIVGTALEQSIDYRDIDYSGKIALVIGNEGNGMSHLVTKECDYIAKIPMYGKTNSLNASVAAGIMIYEVVRNRK